MYFRIEGLRQKLAKMTGKDIYLDIREVKRPEIDAQLVAENVALQLQRRIAFRRAMKRAIASAMRLGALGIKIMVSGFCERAEFTKCLTVRNMVVPIKLRVERTKAKVNPTKVRPKRRVEKALPEDCISRAIGKIK